MFSKGDIVVYEMLGVCRVADIRRERFAPLPAQEYYVLERVYAEGTTVYAPVNGEPSKLREITECSAAEEVLLKLPSVSAEWRGDEQELKEQYREIMKGRDLERLAALVKALYAKRTRQTSIGRKFHTGDMRTLDEAKKLLFEELAAATGAGVKEIAERFEAVIGG